MGIKKKVFLTWLALELSGLVIALPTAAMVIQNNAPKTYPRIAAANLPTTAGQTRILLSSNGPFAIISSDVIGELKISFQVKGTVNGHVFGKTAQAPGPLTACVQILSPESNLLYQSATKTSDRIGPVLDQAVMVEIKYDPSFTPKFDIIHISDDQYKRAAKPNSCHQPT
ncbi:MAG: hypothetical protein JKX72_06415 [Robiginitomaculum sp.]|nr:hypothetical protein [Robiginitomaculum sp.]